MDVTRRDLLLLAAAAGVAGPMARPALAAPTGAYDDGSTAVPGGLTGDPERVIVVGAGWAGLTVANALRNAGVDHVVLEGRHRIGGRAKPVTLGGIPVDLGCSWIHGPYGNPMAKFADQAGVRRTDANVEHDAPIIRFYDGRVGREVGVTGKLSAFGHTLRFAELDSSSLATELGPRSSVRDGARAYCDREGISGDDRHHFDTVVRGFSEFTYGTHWSRLSLARWAYANSESTYLGLGEGDFPVGTYRPLVRAMAGQETVRLGHRVTSVETHARGVVVRGRHGHKTFRLRGSHVAVTVPLGVLKTRDIHFAPGLPRAKRAAIANTGFGAVEKIALVFDAPFWSDATHTHIIYQSPNSALEFPWWLDLNRILGIPVLIAFTGGPFARSIGRLSHADRLGLALAKLREILGRDIPEPAAVGCTDWQRDRFSRGSYTAMLVGRTLDDLDDLAAPVGGRILFAGEATNRARHSTADGALSSGIREAKRLLRRPAVTLSAG
jgi:polyamine oxidase